MNLSHIAEACALGLIVAVLGGCGGSGASGNTSAGTAATTGVTDPSSSGNTGAGGGATAASVANPKCTVRVSAGASSSSAVTAAPALAPSASASTTISMADATVVIPPAGCSIAITVTRSSVAAAGAASVSYATKAGTATEGVDYAGQSGTLTWVEDDATPRVIDVPIVSLGGAGKTFTVQLSAAGGDALVGTQSSTAVNYASGAASNPQGSVYFAAPVYFVGPKGGAATLAVNRAAGDTKDSAKVVYFTASHTAAPPTDLTATTGSLTWAAGDTTPKTIVVPINATSLGGKDFSVTLTAQSGTSVGAPGSATVAILPASDALQIHAAGNQLIDAFGNTVQLRGATVEGLEAPGCGWDASGDLTAGATEPDWSMLTAWKLNTVRLPISRDCWSNPAYQSLVAKAVRDATTAGLAVILSEDESPEAEFTSSAATPAPNLPDLQAFWISVSQTFSGTPAVLFELGPSSATGPNYTAAAYNSLIGAIRLSNATNVIILGGTAMDNDLSWWTRYPPTDPTGQVALAYRTFPTQSNGTPGSAVQTALNAPGVPVIITATGGPVGPGADTSFLTGLLGIADRNAWGVIATAWNPATGAAAGSNTLIQSTATYLPTVGEGQVFHNWTFDHENTSVNVGPVPASVTAAGTGGSSSSVGGYGPPNFIVLPAETTSTPVRTVAVGSGGSIAPSSSALTTLLVNLAAPAAANRHLLVGHHSQYWHDDVTDNIAGLQKLTGQLPAILGTGYNVGGSPEDGIALSNQYLAQGGLVMLSWWAGNPTSGVSTTDSTNVAINFPSLITPGSPEFQNWHATLDAFAAAATRLSGPVYFRPFLELNGNWFWWGGHDPGQFITLWQQTHDYLVKTKGLTNLVWVYCVNDGLGRYADYYPGNAYVDVVSMDEYPPTTASDSQAMYQALVPLGKPIILAEAGDTYTFPAPFTVDINTTYELIKNAYPDVVAVLNWCQAYDMDLQLNAPQVMSNHSNIVLSTLPTAPQ
jgi:Glycosyl hydrolase family 26/Calx-beta domain/Cellulase (glycosyl hydrolase family 5)